MARPTRRTGNLPAETTSFVGRRREIAELRKKLTTARLVTLVDPGGVGTIHFLNQIAFANATKSPVSVKRANPTCSLRPSPSIGQLVTT
jgi:hypothetical protein